MPRVISDELFEKLIAPIPEGRLLGVMGLLERVRGEAKRVEWYKVEICGDLTDCLFEEKEGETKTNSN